MIPEYREKWRFIENSIELISRDNIIEVINAAYFNTGYPEPEILFYNNPLIAIQKVACIKDFKIYLGRDIHIKFYKRVFEHLEYGLKQQLDANLFIRLRNQTLYTEYPYYSTNDKSQTCYFPHSVINCLKEQIIADLEKTNTELEYSDVLYFISNFTRPAEWAAWACMFDFCISVLKCHHDKIKWQVIQQLIQNSGFLFMYENVCIAINRPSKLSYDEENLLHADEEPALQFADGYGIYANHGTSTFVS